MSARVEADVLAVEEGGGDEPTSCPPRERRRRREAFLRAELGLDDSDDDASDDEEDTRDDKVVADARGAVTTREKGADGDARVATAVVAAAPPRRIEPLLSYNALPLIVLRLLGLGLAYTGPGVPPERSRTTRAHLFAAARPPRAARRGRECDDDDDDDERGGDGSDGDRSGSGGDLSAARLAGRIHGDIERGFVRAEVVPADVLLRHDSYAAAKDAGCVRTEGRDYRVHAGDVVLVKWSSSK